MTHIFFKVRTLWLIVHCLSYNHYAGVSRIGIKIGNMSVFAGFLSVSVFLIKHLKGLHID